MKHIVLTLILFLIFDIIWLKIFAGSFFAEQLQEIGRFTEAGDFDVRLIPAVAVYVLMAALIEVFIFENRSIKTQKQYILYGFFMGLGVYGVFDLTNRAILETYPLPMVIVDMAWGSCLFAAVAFLSYELRNRLTFL